MSRRRPALRRRPLAVRAARAAASRRGRDGELPADVGHLRVVVAVGERIVQPGQVLEGVEDVVQHQFGQVQVLGLALAVDLPFDRAVDAPHTAVDALLVLGRTPQRVGDRRAPRRLRVAMEPRLQEQRLPIPARRPLTRPRQLARLVDVLLRLGPLPEPLGEPQLHLRDIGQAEGVFRGDGEGVGHRGRSGTGDCVRSGRRSSPRHKTARDGNRS
jgi:hypothetical protein